MNYNGKIIVLAYPDTFVSMSDEWICKLLPLVGLGTWDYIKAGHAALILIENETGKARYFDFGRYVTPKGHGRVRGSITDAELEIPYMAQFSANGKLKNLDTFLRWLDANPQKTHGQGRLLASVCDSIDFKKAENYINDLQSRGSIPYGAFDKTSSNCARFVTDTILKSTSEKKVIKALKFNKKFTPSAVGNVEKAACGEIFQVFEGVVKPFDGSAFKENLTNYFSRKNDKSAAAGSGVKRKVSRLRLRSRKDISVLDDRENYASVLPNNAQALSGTGCNAWFELIPEDILPKYHFRIRRYNDLCEIDFDGVYHSEEIDISKPYEFTYDSHCQFCHIIQEDKKIKLDCVGRYAKFSSSQKVRSA